MDGKWISVDSRLPNDLVAEALECDRLEPFVGYQVVRREVPCGQSRFDFRLDATGRQPCLLEVKSVTLVIGGIACFPDAVTSRGRRHVEELASLVAQGFRSAVAFIVQREDATGMRPHDESDPQFGRALRVAAQKGVEAYAYACRVQMDQVEIVRALPVCL
jgi:sugar fermentation stimulation protein A